MLSLHGRFICQVPRSQVTQSGSKQWRLMCIQVSRHHMKKKKILLISCYFPPSGGIQVQRAVSLAKYLPQCGFEVHVLTTRNPSVPTFDPELINTIPAEVKIHRAWTLEPPFHLRKKLWLRMSGNGKRKSATSVKSSSETRGGGLSQKLRSFVVNRISRTLCPDPQVLWYPFGLRKAMQIVEEHGIDVVLVTAPPFSAYLIGNELKRRYPHIQLVSDIRDEWLRYFAKEFAFRGNSHIEDRSAQIEREMVERSDYVVSVTEAARQSVRDRYPEQPAEKFALVPNGFDPDAFATFTSRGHNTGKIVVTYTGTIYEQASPKVWLDALDSMPEHIRSRFETRFIGRMAEEFDQSMFENRKSAVTVLGFVPQQTAFRYIEETDYVLLPWKDTFNIPGKAYEYLATRKPIVALGCPGTDLANLLQVTQAGWFVDRTNETAIKALIERLYNLNGASDLGVNSTAVRQFERARLTSCYADLIRHGSQKDWNEIAAAVART